MLLTRDNPARVCGIAGCCYAATRGGYSPPPEHAGRTAPAARRAHCRRNAPSSTAGPAGRSWWGHGVSRTWENADFEATAAAACKASGSRSMGRRSDETPTTSASYPDHVSGRTAATPHSATEAASIAAPAPRSGRCRGRPRRPSGPPSARRRRCARARAGRRRGRVEAARCPARLFHDARALREVPLPVLGGHDDVPSNDDHVRSSCRLRTRCGGRPPACAGLIGPHRRAASAPRSRSLTDIVRDTLHAFRAVLRRPGGNRAARLPSISR